MAGPLLYDRVKETTTTTGTGTVTLLGAVSGFQSFSVVGNTNTCYYTIAGGAEWENGIGTYTSAGTTLSRDKVLSSSNADALVTFSAGTKDVFISVPMERVSGSKGAITKTANYTATKDDDVLFLDATSAAFTLSLPTAVDHAGKSITLKKIDSSANKITIDPSGSQTIDGETTLDLYTQYDGLTALSDGSNWLITWDGLSPTFVDVYCNVSQTLSAATGTFLNLDTERSDRAELHYTSAANLTGTVAKTAGSATLTGTSTSFTTELSVGQVIGVPGTATEVRVVTAIASNTSLTVNSNFANTASAQTATRRNSAVAIRRPGKYVISAAWTFTQIATDQTRFIGRIVKNGGPVLASFDGNTSGGAAIPGVVLAAQEDLARWDYLELWAYQTIAGSTYIDTDTKVEFRLQRAGR